MGGKKNTKLKLYLFISLSMVLIISFYFRFLHGRETVKMENTRPDTSIQELFVPKIDHDTEEDTKSLSTIIEDELQTIMRDIFRPPVTKPQPTETKEVLTEQPVPTREPLMTLKGTVVGKRSSIAIIDNEFLRVGDRINEYTVEYIGKKKVILDSRGRKLRLEILKND